MPTKEEWKRVHAELMAKLHLPCKLVFSTGVRIGQHSFECWPDNCRMTINPEVEFLVPEHLILHEAAHHRAAPMENAHCCSYCDAHCEHWAHVLLNMYREIDFPLPHSTGFEKFAEAAGIKFKIFEQHGRQGILSRNMIAETVTGE